MTAKTEYSLNTKQTGEALELLSNLKENSVSLVFLDPQYKAVRNVLRSDYPLYYFFNKKFPLFFNELIVVKK